MLIEKFCKGIIMSGCANGASIFSLELLCEGDHNVDEALFSIWGSLGSDPRRDQAWAHQDLQSVGSPGRHLPTTRGTIVTPPHSAPLCSSGKQTQLHIQTSIYKYTHTNTMSSKPSSYEFWPAKIEKTPIWRCKKQASKRPPQTWNLSGPSGPAVL